jgi:hypothetical protein
MVKCRLEDKEFKCQQEVGEVNPRCVKEFFTLKELLNM